MVSFGGSGQAGSGREREGQREGYGGCAVSAPRCPYPFGEGRAAADLQGFLPGQAVRRVFDGQVCERKVFVNVKVKVNVVGGSGQAGSGREREGQREGYGG